MKYSVELIADKICELGEGPIWNVTDQKLYWTDITQGDIWQYDPSIRSFSKYLDCDFQIGGFAFNRENKLIIFTDSGVFKVQDLEKKIFIPLFQDIKLTEKERFNDIIVDPEGRIFAGTLIPDQWGGKLYLLENGKEAKIVRENLFCSNGMSFSPDLKTFYHTETVERMF